MHIFPLAFQFSQLATKKKKKKKIQCKKIKESCKHKDTVNKHEQNTQPLMFCTIYCSFVISQYNMDIKAYEGHSY